jgi:hypothetical protein
VQKAGNFFQRKAGAQSVVLADKGDVTKLRLHRQITSQDGEQAS